MAQERSRRATDIEESAGTNITTDNFKMLEGRLVATSPLSFVDFIVEFAVELGELFFGETRYRKAKPAIFASQDPPMGDRNSGRAKRGFVQFDIFWRVDVCGEVSTSANGTLTYIFEHDLVSPDFGFIPLFNRFPLRRAFQIVRTRIRK
jgi:hypothetical protein